MAATITVVALGFLCADCNAEAGDFTVKASRGRLSVTADEAQFGHIMEELARKAGFEVTISTDVAIKTISTNFRDLELEQGINRLMGLIRHRNFFISSGRDGKIKKIDIFGKGKSTTINPRKRKKTGDPTVMLPTTTQMTPDVMDSPRTDTPKGHKRTVRPSTNKRIIKGVPYIPPANVPEYIPPGRGISKDRK